MCKLNTRVIEFLLNSAPTQLYYLVFQILFTSKSLCNINYRKLKKKKIKFTYSVFTLKQQTCKKLTGSVIVFC